MARKSKVQEFSPIGVNLDSMPVALKADVYTSMQNMRTTGSGERRRREERVELTRLPGVTKRPGRRAFEPGPQPIEPLPVRRAGPGRIEQENKVTAAPGAPKDPLPRQRRSKGTAVGGVPLGRLPQSRPIGGRGRQDAHELTPRRIRVSPPTEPPRVVQTPG